MIKQIKYKSSLLFLMLVMLISYDIVSAMENDGLTVTAGTWYLNWDQSDAVKNGAITNELIHEFTIDNSFAREIAVSGKWKKIQANLKYIDGEKEYQEFSDSNHLKALLGKLQMVFDPLDALLRFTSTKTGGKSRAVDLETGNTAYVDFDTELMLADLIFYPNLFQNKILGIGYRQMDYTLPQSIYIVGGPIPVSMVEPEMQWRAGFVTASVNLGRSVADSLNENNKFWGHYVNLIGGYGVDVNPTSRNADDANVGNYLNGDTGWFYELEAGLVFNKRFNTILCFINTGFRYSEIMLDTKSDSEVYIYARAKSQFYGPYLNVNVSF